MMIKYSPPMAASLLPRQHSTSMTRTAPLWSPPRPHLRPFSCRRRWPRLRPLLLRSRPHRRPRQVDSADSVASERHRRPAPPLRQPARPSSALQRRPHLHRHQLRAGSVASAGSARRQLRRRRPPRLDLAASAGSVQSPRPPPRRRHRETHSRDSPARAESETIRPTRQRADNGGRSAAGIGADCARSSMTHLYTR